jgi:hypothetical protein
LVGLRQLYIILNSKMIVVVYLIVQELLVRIINRKNVKIMLKVKAIPPINQVIDLFDCEIQLGKICKVN